MPTMHRISCFRDDVVFVVYLYQRYVYQVDKTRGMYATEKKSDAAVAPQATSSETTSTTESKKDQ